MRCVVNGFEEIFSGSKVATNNNFEKDEKNKSNHSYLDQNFYHKGFKKNKKKSDFDGINEDKKSIRILHDEINNLKYDEKRNMMVPIEQPINEFDGIEYENINQDLLDKICDYFEQKANNNVNKSYYLTTENNNNNKQSSDDYEVSISMMIRDIFNQLSLIKPYQKFEPFTEAFQKIEFNNLPREIKVEIAKIKKQQKFVEKRYIFYAIIKVIRDSIKISYDYVSDEKIIKIIDNYFDSEKKIITTQSDL